MSREWIKGFLNPLFIFIKSMKLTSSFVWVLLLLVAVSPHAQPTLGLIHFEDTAQDGYTLFSNNTETYLIDNCGLIVNKWSSDFRPGRAVYLLENGDLLRTAEMDGAFQISGRGGRFERFDWEGNMIWYYELNDDQRQAHHDIEPLPNGNFLCLAWEKISAEQAVGWGYQYAGLELWSEAVYELKPLSNNGAEIVWEWHLWDHLVQAHDPGQSNYGLVDEHPRKVDINYRSAATTLVPNWAHLNSIRYHSDLDQIMLSARGFSEVWVIDHSTTIAEAATAIGGASGHGGDLLYRFGNPDTYGVSLPQQLNEQHDAQWLPEWHFLAGQMLAFNNNDSTDRSAIKIWEPVIGNSGEYLLDPDNGFVSNQVETLYSAPGFFSPFMSSVQPLRNGNLFICEADQGRFFEVSLGDQIVWEYINPVNSNGGPAPQGSEARQNQTFAARKYYLDFPAFSQVGLTSGAPVEVNPDSSECYLPEIDLPKTELDILLRPNPASEQVTIALNQVDDFNLKCFNATGEVISSDHYEGTNEVMIDLSNYLSGVYFLLLTTDSGERIAKRLIVN